MSNEQHTAVKDASEPEPLEDDSEKSKEIVQACRDRDAESIRKHAASDGGLFNDQLRRRAWPILLGCEDQELEIGNASKELPSHRDEAQVQLDVDRSFVYYPEAESEDTRDARKAELSQVILTVLRRHPMLHYFQGYHDIVQVLLLVLGLEAAPSAVARLSLLRIRDFMLPTISGTEPHLRLLPVILYAADPELAMHLSHTQPFFALPATLTLYAHEIEEYGSIARLFDFLLASEAVVSVYLFAAIVLSRKDKLLEIESDEPEMLHSVLSKLPRPLNLESLIHSTVQLCKKHPPERLPGRTWAHVSSNSVLKTTHNFSRLASQTLQDGEHYFERQAAELKRQEALQARLRKYRTLVRRYRRPVTYTSVTILVAVVAMFLRRVGPLEAIPGLNTAVLGLQHRLLELWQRFTT